MRIKNTNKEKVTKERNTKEKDNRKRIKEKKPFRDCKTKNIRVFRSILFFIAFLFMMTASFATRISVSPSEILFRDEKSVQKIILMNTGEQEKILNINIKKHPELFFVEEKIIVPAKRKVSLNVRLKKYPERGLITDDLSISPKGTGWPISLEQGLIVKIIVAEKNTEEKSKGIKRKSYEDHGNSLQKERQDNKQKDENNRIIIKKAGNDIIEGITGGLIVSSIFFLIIIFIRR